jgi:hypothetical protein
MNYSEYNINVMHNSTICDYDENRRRHLDTIKSSLSLCKSLSWIERLHSSSFTTTTPPANMIDTFLDQKEHYRMNKLHQLHDILQNPNLLDTFHDTIVQIQCGLTNASVKETLLLMLLIHSRQHRNQGNNEDDDNAQKIEDLEQSKLGRKKCQLEVQDKQKRQLKEQKKQQQQPLQQ